MSDFSNVLSDIERLKERLLNAEKIIATKVLGIGDVDETLPDGWVEAKPEPRYMVPKTGQNRVFNFVNGEVIVGSTWHKCKIYAILSDDLNSIRLVSDTTPIQIAMLSDIRILEFGPENVPPKEIPVSVSHAPGKYHTSIFFDFDDGKIIVRSGVWPEWDFVDFLESAFEWKEEQ